MLKLKDRIVSIICSHLGFLKLTLHLNMIYDCISSNLRHCKVSNEKLCKMQNKVNSYEEQGAPIKNNHVPELMHCSVFNPCMSDTIWM